MLLRTPDICERSASVRGMKRLDQVGTDGRARGSGEKGGSYTAEPPVEVSCTFVGLGDTDAFGMLYWAAPFRWAQEGAEGLFRRAGHPLEEHLSGIDYPVAHTSIDYLRPVRLGDQLEVRTWVTRVGTRSVEMVTEVFTSRRELAVRIRRVLVAYRSDSVPPAAENWIRGLITDGETVT